MSSMTGAGGMGATGDNIPKGYKKGSLQQFTPEQMQLFQSMFGQVGPQSFLSKLAGGSQEGFEQMEAPAMRQFQGLTGQLASRFSGQGMGARKSSGFQNAFGQQASDFASDLASKRMGLQRQALMDLMGLSGQLLGQRPQENFLVKKDMPFWKQLTSQFSGGLGEGLGRAAGSFAGGF